MKEGAIYYRSNAKNESAPISSEEDMRELITLAVKKGVAQQLEDYEEQGFIRRPPSSQETDALKYKEEREEYEERKPAV
jgi:hypothetical protein